VVVGTRLAERLHVDVGNKLVLTATNAHGEVVEELLRIVGIFKLGSDAMDGAFIELPLAAMRKVLGLTDDQATQVGLILKRPDEQAMVLAQAQQAMATEKLAVYPWETLLPALATWVSAGNSANRVICGVILFVACFTILNTILMSIIERKREFAMLLALGTAPRLLRAQVFLETVMLAVVGCALGVGLGGSISYAAQKHGIDLSQQQEAGATVGSLALDMHIHPSLTASDALFVAGIVLFVTMAIAIYPTLRSSRVDVANTLRSQ
jgi:putative ABC transport system permease protein